MTSCLLSCALLAVPLFAQNPWLQPSYVAPEGQGVIIPLSAPSAVSLNGEGSLTCTPSCTAATSVTYTAPAHITPQHQIDGCMVEPNDSVYNTRIDALPVHAASSGWIANLNAVSSSFGFGFGADFPHGVAASTSPTVAVWGTYGSQGQSATGANIGAAEYIPYSQIGQFTTRSQAGNFKGPNGSDQHIMVLEKDTCRWHELYNLLMDAGQQNCNTHPGYLCNASSSTSWNWSSYQQLDPVTQTFTSVGGMRLMPQMVTLQELLQGSVHHAIRVTECAGCASSATVWPGGVNGAYSKPAIPPTCTNSTNGFTCLPPLGSRFRLKKQSLASLPATAANGAVYIADDAQAANSTCSPSNAGGTHWLYCKSNGSTWAPAVAYTPMTEELLTAMADYGMIFTDTGTGCCGMAFDPEIQTNPTANAAVNQVGGSGPSIPPAQTEIVDQSSFIISDNSEEVNPNNGYVAPQDFAVLTAANANGSYSVPLVLQGVTIGVFPGIQPVMQAGMSYQFQSWVNGTSNSAVTWSLLSGTGSVTASGLYTAPASVPAGTVQTDSLLVTSAADPQATTPVNIQIIPAGTIRIDEPLAWNANSTDGFGNKWNGHLGAMLGPSSGVPYDTWGYLKDNDPQEAAQYENTAYTYGLDMVYSFIVPNGLYDVRLMTGQPQSQHSQTSYRDPISIEANGQVALHDWGPQSRVNYAGGMPSDAHVPVLVTTNILYVAARCHSYGLDAGTYNNSPLLSGLVITPEANSNPHWAIDTEMHHQTGAYGQYDTAGTPGTNNRIKPDQALDLFVVDYGTGDAEPYLQVNNPPAGVSIPASGITWSLNGPGTLATSNGVEYYQAPASGPATAVVTACGAKHCASGSIYTSGATFALNLH